MSLFWKHQRTSDCQCVGDLDLFLFRCSHDGGGGLRGHFCYSRRNGTSHCMINGDWSIADASCCLDNPFSLCRGDSLGKGKRLSDGGCQNIGVGCVSSDCTGSRNSLFSCSIESLFDCAQ